jgi:UDP-2,4-diacetamido-2,4,6-trideoxy-beta-L-altropyranose hydrolase
MSETRVLIFVNAGAEVGGGHVLRALALSQALEARGAQCAIVGPPPVTQVANAFAPDAVVLEAIGASARELMHAAGARPFDAVVFDHFALGEVDHSAMAQGRPILVVDELADRALFADLVLDCGPQRRASDYDGLIPEGARLLLGPQYAPVRAEFPALREAALSWRGEPVQRILVSLGLTDIDGVTGQVVERLRPRLTTEGIDVVLGAGAPSLAGLTRIARRDTRMAIHVDTPHMARLTAEADLAIGAAGSSTWERCALGLPSLMLVLAENQQETARAMAQAQAGVVLDPADPDFPGKFDRALMRLLADANLRRDLAQRSAELCDGLGAARAADAFLALIAAKRR